MFYVFVPTSYTHVRNKKIKKSSIGHLIYKNSHPYTEDREQGESYGSPLKNPQLSVYVFMCGSAVWSWKGGGMLYLFESGIRRYFVHRTVYKSVLYKAAIPWGDVIPSNFWLLIGHLIVVSKLSPSSRSCVQLLCCCLQRGVDTPRIVYFQESLFDDSL